MKGTVIVLLFFIAGCIAGWSGLIDMEKFGGTWDKGTMCILYVLIFTVGIGMGCNKDLKRMIKALSPKLLLLPAATPVLCHPESLPFQMESVGLPRRRERIRVLFPVIRAHCRIQGGFSRSPCRFRTGDHRIACEHIQGAVHIGCRTSDEKALRTVRACCVSRSDGHGRVPAGDSQGIRQRNSSCSHCQRGHLRFQRSVFSFLFLLVLTRNAISHTSTFLRRADKG